jgi:hypothetical protein
MSKAHLIVTDAAIHEGDTLESLCGLTIFRAKICLMWDAVSTNSPLALSTLLCCKKCADAYISASPGRYVFGICEFREGSHEQTEQLVQGPIPRD